MTNPITKLWAVLGRRRSRSTAHDAVTITAVEGYHVELSVPPEGDGQPVTVGFTLAELLEIHTLSELRERAADKARQARQYNGRPDPADFKGRPIGDYLAALGVPEDTSRYEKKKGTTTLRFNLGQALRGRAADEPPKPREDSPGGAT